MRSTGKRSGSRSASRRAPAPGPEWVLADANSFFLPFRGGIDLAAEVERLAAPARLAVAASTLAELDRLVARRVPLSEAARELARRLPRLYAPGRGDQGLLDLARREALWVLTADRELQRRLGAAGVTVLAPRQRSGLALIPPRVPTAPPPPGERVRATVKNGARVDNAEPREGRRAGR